MKRRNFLYSWLEQYTLNGSEVFQSLRMGEEETGDDSFLDLNDINQWICWAREEVGLETIGHRACRVKAIRTHGPLYSSSIYSSHQDFLLYT
jgi:hypothetical protein